MNFRNNKFRIILTDILLAVLLVIFVVLIPYFYISNEKTFYYWDYNYYHITTLIKGLEFYNLDSFTLDRLVHELKVIWRSSNNEYSDYFKLPIIPLVLLFGDSRAVYITSISIVYLLPLVLSISYLATIIIQNEKRKVFWITCFISILTPSLWVPTLKGFPDSFAVSLICFSSAIYLKSNFKKYTDILLIAFCLAFAVLFRRHIAYDVLTFFLVIMALNIKKCLMIENKKLLIDITNFGIESKKLVLLGILSTLFLSIVGWPFVKRIIDSNIEFYYTTWHRSVFESIFYFTEFFGLITIATALFGLLLSIYKRIFNIKALIFTLLFLTINFLVWLLFVKQTGYQYTLHFTPWIILGFVSLLFAGLNLLAGLKKKIFVCVFIVLLIANFSHSLIGTSFKNLSSLDDVKFTKISKLMFSEKMPPEQRSDYQEVLKLIEYLRKISLPDDIIYIAAMSDILNEDTINQTNRYIQKIDYPTTLQKFWQRNGYILNIPYIPFADSIHSYPLELLIKSKYIVIADPLQYHLRLDEHDVLKVIYEIFKNNWEFSRDFQNMNHDFHLQDNVTVNVYKRLNETSLATLIKTLNQMEEFVGDLPGGQLSWMDINPNIDNIKIQKQSNKFYFTGIKFNQDINEIDFLYIDNVIGDLELKGDLEFVNRVCDDTQIMLSTVDDQGIFIDSSNLVKIDKIRNNFVLKVNSEQSNRLILKITNNQTNNICIFNIKNLSLS